MSKTMIAAAAGLAIVLTDAPAIGEAVKASHGPGLVETMMATQSHHAKLWLAGNARNWELAEYQVDELKEGLEDAAKHIPDYKGVPVGSMIESLHAAADRRGRKRDQGARSRKICRRLRQSHSCLQHLSRRGEPGLHRYTAAGNLGIFQSVLCTKTKVKTHR